VFPRDAVPERPGAGREPQDVGPGPFPRRFLPHPAWMPQGAAGDGPVRLPAESPTAAAILQGHPYSAWDM